MVLLGAALQVAQICCVTLITLGLNTTVSGLFLKPLSVLLPLLLPAIGVAFAIYWAGAHFLERRPLRELSPGSAPETWLLGGKWLSSVRARFCDTRASRFRQIRGLCRL